MTLIQLAAILCIGFSGVDSDRCQDSVRHCAEMRYRKAFTDGGGCSEKLKDGTRVCVDAPGVVQKPAQDLSPTDFVDSCALKYRKWSRGK